MIDINLKLANQDDFEEIAEIYMEEFSKPPFNEPWTTEKANKKIKIFSEYCDIFKIEKENKIIGFIIINPNHWCPGEYIFGEEMAVRKEFQNQGIGTEVLKQIFERYKEKGYKKFIGIANLESKATDLYRKIGISDSKENKVIEKNL